jgi:hypothetical protein
MSNVNGSRRVDVAFLQAASEIKVTVRLAILEGNDDAET